MFCLSPILPWSFCRFIQRWTELGVPMAYQDPFFPGNGTFESMIFPKYPVKGGRCYLVPLYRPNVLVREYARCGNVQSSLTMIWGFCCSLVIRNFFLKWYFINSITGGSITPYLNHQGRSPGPTARFTEDCIVGPASQRRHVAAFWLVGGCWFVPPKSGWAKGAAKFPGTVWKT